MCERIVETGRDAVDDVPQARRADLGVQWDGSWSGRRLEVDDDASFLWSAT